MISYQPNHPNTIIIGAQKAGTTSLYDWLGQHPAVFAPAAGKDLHYFLFEDYFRDNPNYLNKIYQDHTGQKVVLHAGVNYMLYTKALDQIQSFNPQTKVIVVLRDPAKRAVSAHGFMHKLGLEKEKDFDKLIKQELTDPPTQEQSPREQHQYIRHSLYYDQLLDVYKHFPKEQVYICFYEDMVKDKTAFVASIFDFLSIDSKQPISFTRKNETGAVKYNWFNKILYGKSKYRSFIRKNIIDNLMSPSALTKIRHKLRDWNTTGSQQKKEPAAVNHVETLIPVFEKDVHALAKDFSPKVIQLWPSYFKDSKPS
jgi:hypothetical protein